jgi:hypothetical protein
MQTQISWSVISTKILGLWAPQDCVKVKTLCHVLNFANIPLTRWSNRWWRNMDYWGLKDNAEGCIRISWSRAFHEKLILAQLLKKFPAFSGNRIFISVFTRACFLTLGKWEGIWKTLFFTWCACVYLSLLLDRNNNDVRNISIHISFWGFNQNNFIIRFCYPVLVIIFCYFSCSLNSIKY